MPLDYDVGKPSVFDKRKKFILEKVDQARTLAERVINEPKGTNFDVGPNRSNGGSFRLSWNLHGRSMSPSTTMRDCHACSKYRSYWAT
jgi:hypothetical protein